VARKGQPDIVVFRYAIRPDEIIFALVIPVRARKWNGEASLKTSHVRLFPKEQTDGRREAAVCWTITGRSKRVRQKGTG
jgi:hypothetical protein